MTVATVAVVDVTNPTEVQAWLDANPTVTISQVAVENHMFYIFYS
jgi:hypothetical protein